MVTAVANVAHEGGLVAAGLRGPLQDAAMNRFRFFLIRIRGGKFGIGRYLLKRRTH